MKLLPWLSTSQNHPGLTQVVNTQFEWVKWETVSPEKSGWWICCNFPGSVDSHRQWNGRQKFYCAWYSTTWCHCFATKGCRWWAGGSDPWVQRLVPMHRPEWHPGRWLPEISTLNYSCDGNLKDRVEFGKNRWLCLGFLSAASLWILCREPE